jgi:hypothetical protein
MHSPNTRSESFSTFKVSLRVVDSAAMLSFSFHQNYGFENGSTGGGTLVTYLKFVGLSGLAVPARKINCALSPDGFRRASQSTHERSRVGGGQIRPKPKSNQFRDQKFPRVYSYPQRKFDTLAATFLYWPTPLRAIDARSGRILCCSVP